MVSARKARAGKMDTGEHWPSSLDYTRLHGEFSATKGFCFKNTTYIVCMYIYKLTHIYIYKNKVDITSEVVFV